MLVNSVEKITGVWIGNRLLGLLGISGSCFIGEADLDPQKIGGILGGSR